MKLISVDGTLLNVEKIKSIYQSHQYVASSGLTEETVMFEMEGEGSYGTFEDIDSVLGRLRSGGVEII